MLEATLRRLVPYEKTQGACLLALGRVMVKAIRSIYLGKEDKVVNEVPRGRQRDKSTDSFVESEDGTQVPENDLVRETRQVLIRGELHPFSWRDIPIC
jgi:hypothetical protein